MRLIAALVVGFAATNGMASEADAEYRHVTMEAIGGHMQAIVKILRQEVPHGSHLTLHANALADMASITDTLFPEGSEGGEALPAIWENPDDFQSKVVAFDTAAAGFKAAAGSGDGAAIGGAMQKLGQACKSCHDDYREE